ncbi:hypothetical protein [Lysobacter sp. Root667]|uniref:hypothetical protein n=1 Tax=Lysobacter sp. Root667 TaxID=1736581 RepID=UPI0012DCC242|nr:hypothetical protein [Lysobacter sp. Root667]
MQFKLGLGALIGIGSFMAIPPYMLWGLATFPMLVLAVISLSKRRDRFTLAVAYIISGLGGFAIGHFFWRADELSWAGIKLMILLVTVCTITAVRILVVKSDED